MNTDILCIDTIAIDEFANKNGESAIAGTDDLPPGTSLPVSRRFGMVDLWKIRGTKKYFRNYQTSDSFSI